MIVEIWHTNGRYFRKIDDTTEEITVDEYTTYFTD